MTDIITLSLGLLYFIAGLFALIGGSDKLVESAIKIARMLGISTLIIGITLVGMGTSLPELAFAIMASINDSAGLILGNVIGSNIANIGLVLALAILYGGTIKIKRRILNIDGVILFGITILFFLLMIDQQITVTDSLILLFAYLFYLLFLFESLPLFMKLLDIRRVLDSLFHLGGRLWNLQTLFKMRDKGVTVETYEHIVDSKLDGKEAKAIIEKKQRGKDFVTVFREILFTEIFKQVFVFLIAIAVIYLGALLMLEGALKLADFFNVNQTFIGLTIVAVGTSLPEMGVSIAAVRKKVGNILIGNIIGSNISNILLIIGISGLINVIVVPMEIVFWPAILMVVITALLLQAIVREYDIEKKEAMILLAVFIIFLISTSFVSTLG